ncbi:MAG TPA: PilZ domain-containing protein [Bradyrhizobium sp.]|nr:PilZ domain-containing protein [Bradyrhizobium sp.]
MDKRATPRRVVRKPGIIEFGGGAFSCMVRDLSTAGAALDVPSVAGIPDRFTLAVPADDLHFQCHVIWRKEMHMGVSFE